jgi:hypothetical protein
MIGKKLAHYEDHESRADGQRFIMVKAVVLNWLEELKQRVPIH